MKSKKSSKLGAVCSHQAKKLKVFARRTLILKRNNLDYDFSAQIILFPARLGIKRAADVFRTLAETGPKYVYSFQNYFFFLLCFIS